MDETAEVINELEKLLSSLPKTEEAIKKEIKIKMESFFSNPEHTKTALTQKDYEEIAKGIYSEYSQFLISKKEEIQSQLEYLRTWIE